VLNFAVSPGISTVTLGGLKTGVVLLIADYNTATRFWMPTIAGTGTFGNFSDGSATAPLLVSGPYLVREATLSGNALALTGDLSESTNLTVFGVTNLRTISWNGKAVSGLRSLAPGTFTATLQAQLSKPTIPKLMKLEWKFMDSLPEIASEFDDSAMVDANHTNTTSVFPPFYGEPWILYADDYGFHVSDLSSCSRLPDLYVS
jgi:hypothetical protein